MESTVEPLEGNKVKLSIAVTESEFETDIDDAFKRIAREVRLPGFRPGKAPRKVLEARIGLEHARIEALERALPKYYLEAIDEHDVDVIAQPEWEITAGQESGDVAFDATVEVRPVVNAGGYASLRVEIPSPDVTEDEVDERIEHLRNSFSTLESVERPAQTGDQVTLDIEGSRDGEAMAGLTADDYLYEVGSGTIVPEFDDQLAGAKAGDVVEFTADHPQPDEDPVDFKLTVKDVKEKVLPDADDAFAAEASEFETIAELRDDLATRMAMVKKIQSRMAISQKTAEALAELVEEDVPDALVDQEVQNRLQDLAMRLQAQGIGIEQYLASMGQDQEEWIADMRSAATQGVKVDLALRAVATAEGLEVDDDELEAEYEAVAQRVGEKVSKVRKQLERNGQVSAVRSDLRTRKALEWLVEHVELVDEAGNAVERDALEVSPVDDPDDSDEIDTDAADEADATEDE